MSFIRPEARAALWRWREVLVGLGVVLIGVWWVSSGGAVVQWIGVALSLAGSAFIAAGLQRGRFRGANDGPGVVRTDEGQIAYFGPLTGGAVALSEITKLAYDPTGRPAHWVLTQPGQPNLHIPVTADGAEALFDAFTSLPGLRPEELIRIQKQPAATPTVLWTRPTALRAI